MINTNIQSVPFQGYAGKQKAYSLNFKSLLLSNYIHDLRELNTYGQKIINKLPTQIKNTRIQTISEAVNHIKSNEFFSYVSRKNLKDKDAFVWSMEYTKQQGFLEERADMLLTRTYLELATNYKNSNEIIIPFSGGRDSTAILAASLAFFPNKKYTLVTVLNGMSKNQENVLNQISYIKNLFSKKNTAFKSDTVFIDASADIKKYVIDTAVSDRAIIGAPAVCSDCKIVMEKEIWNFLLNRKNSITRHVFRPKPPIMMGYTRAQSNQNWLEQTDLQTRLMGKEAERYGIKICAPLFDKTEEVYDSLLLLSSLGVPLKHHKSEMKCLAGGLNPEKTDLKRFNKLILAKNQQTHDIPSQNGLLIYINPTKSITTVTNSEKEIQALKTDEKFIQGAFKE